MKSKIEKLLLKYTKKFATASEAKCESLVDDLVDALTDLQDDYLCEEED